MLPLFVASALAADLDPARKVVLSISGMDCPGCEAEIREALGGVDGVAAVEASFAEASACLSLSKPVSDAALVDALKKLKLSAESITTADACPSALLAPAPRDPWGKAEGIDVVTVSTGDDLELDAVAVAGKFTLVDFGAPWCGPCHVAARKLTPYVAAHPDVVVRAISLAGADATAAFATPIAKHHLANAPGLPWMVLYGPDGKVLYRGQDPDAVVKTIEKKR